jgi:arginyl-tRNA synthetase
LKPIPQQIQDLIQQAAQAAQAAGALPPFDLPPAIPVSPAKNPGQGDYGSPLAMSLAKALGQKPLDIAAVLAQHLPPHPMIAEAAAAAPGFLNFRLDESWLLSQAEVMMSEGPAYFQQNIGGGERAQVEFVSANPTGPLHIGRTRGAILGDALARLLEACGWVVEREYYFNNAGRQMEILGLSLRARYLQALGRPADLPEKGYQGSYLVEMAEELKTEVGEAWAESDWGPFKDYAEKQIFAMIQATLARVRIRHDHYFNENSLYDSRAVWETLEKLKAAGYVYEAIGREGSEEDESAQAGKLPATWFRSTALGDGEDRVLVKSNGDPTYLLPDIAYHMNKLDRGYARAYNILGADHVVEAQGVARGLRALGYPAERVQVLIHQFVTFEEGKMSTRGGNYVTLDDLVDEVGVDVVRYFMLARSPNSHLQFDFDLAKQQSNDNPVYYIQNAHVRCSGIFRQVAERGYPENWDAGADLALWGPAERRFLRKALELPEVMHLAYHQAEPHQIAFWTLELARLFHPLYDEVRVLHSEVGEDVARARLRFYRLARGVFAYALGLMGMDAPERM